MKHVLAFVFFFFLFEFENAQASDFYDVINQGEPREQVPEEDESVVAERVKVEEQNRLMKEFTKGNTSLNFVVRIKNASAGSTSRATEHYLTFTTINVADGKGNFARAHSWSAAGLRRNEVAEKWTAEGFSKTFGEVLFYRRPPQSGVSLSVCIYYGFWAYYVGCNHLAATDFYDLAIGKAKSKDLAIRLASEESFDISIQTADEMFLWSSALPDCLNPHNNTNEDGTQNNKNYAKKRAYVENEDKIYKCDASKGWTVE